MCVWCRGTVLLVSQDLPLSQALHHKKLFDLQEYDHHLTSTLNTATNTSDHLDIPTITRATVHHLSR